MKKLLVVLATIFTTLCSKAQTISNVDILHPNSKKVLATVYKEKNYIKKLDSVSAKYNLDELIIVTFFSDGVAKECRVSKKKVKPKTKIYQSI